MSETIEYRVQRPTPSGCWVTLSEQQDLERAKDVLNYWQGMWPNLEFRILRVREEVLRYETVMTDDA